MSELITNGLISSGTIYQKLTPDEYIDLKYLQSSGTQYISTNVMSLTAPYRMQCKYCKTSTSTSDQCIFGERSLGKYVNTYSSYYETKFGNSSSGTDIVNKDVYLDLMSWSGLVVNNTKLINANSTDNQTAVANPPLFAFKENNTSAEAKWFFIGYIYYYTIYEAGKMTYNFVPVKRKSDSVLGMYDTINNIFYTNAGTGTFIAGPEISVSGTSIKTDVISSEDFVEY